MRRVGVVLEEHGAGTTEWAEGLATATDGEVQCAVTAQALVAAWTKVVGWIVGAHTTLPLVDDPLGLANSIGPTLL